MQAGRETRRQGAQRLEEYWQLSRASRYVTGQVTQATVSLSSAESEAKAITKGCVEALYVKHLLEHKTARTLKKMDGQQQRQGRRTTSWTRAQSKALGGADDVGSTVEQARPSSR